MGTPCALSVLTVCADTQNLGQMAYVEVTFWDRMMVLTLCLDVENLL